MSLNRLYNDNNSILITGRDKQEIFNCAEKELGRWLAPYPDDLELSDKEWLRTYKAFKGLGVAIPEKYAQEINSAIRHRATKKVSRLNIASPANTVDIDDEQHNDMHR